MKSPIAFCSYLLLCGFFLVQVNDANALRADLHDVVSGNAFIFDSQEKRAKPLVVVFLSAKCPCSNAHIDEIRTLKNAHSEIDFLGVNANADEDEETSKNYFRDLKLGFPVVRDPQLKLTDYFKALKTPHVFVMDRSYKVVYRGGVTSSLEPKQAEVRFLSNALENMAKGQAVAVVEGRTLGCFIRRKK